MFQYIQSNISIPSEHKYKIFNIWKKMEKKDRRKVKRERAEELNVLPRVQSELEFWRVKLS